MYVHCSETIGEPPGTVQRSHAQSHYMVFFSIIMAVLVLWCRMEHFLVYTLSLQECSNLPEPLFMQ